MKPAQLYIITGASRGLGQAIAAQLLAEPQVHVLSIARHTSAALEAEAQRSGAQLAQWTLDLLDVAPACERLSQWLAAWLDQYPSSQSDGVGLHLINNAALLPAHIAPVSDTDAASIDRVLHLNLHVPMQLTAQFLRSTEAWAQASGASRKLLNISSGLARVAMASMAPYSAAKAGLDQFTRCLAKEELRKPHGARVCALAPGVVDTGMQQQMREATEQDFPDAKGFRFLHASGRLMQVQTAAKMALELLHHPNFGAEPLAELRQ